MKAAKVDNVDLFWAGFVGLIVGSTVWFAIAAAYVDAAWEDGFKEGAAAVKKGEVECRRVEK